MKIQRGRDIDAVSAVRERFPELPLMVDANGDYPSTTQRISASSTRSI